MRDGNPSERLIQSTIELGAKNGLLNLTTKKIARHAGVSEGMIYFYFEGKTNLIEACFFQIDRRIAAAFERSDSMSLSDKPPEEEVYTLWEMLFQKLLAAPDELIFYRRFLGSTYYTPEVEEKRLEYFSSFAEIVTALINRYDVYGKCTSTLVWEYLLSTTYMFAERVIQGKYPADKNTTQQIFTLIYSGISGLVDN